MMLSRKTQLILTSATLALATASANATTFTWSGASAPNSVNWSVGGATGNWSTGAAPSGTADIVMAGSTNTGTSGTPLNNNAIFSLNSLTFGSTAGAFFIGGSNSFAPVASTTITQSSSSAQSIANTIDGNGFSNAYTLTLTGSGTGIVTLNGAITEKNGSSKTATLIKNGTSTYALNGANSISGGTTITDGTLRLGNAQALGAAGSNVSMSGGTLDLATSTSVNAYNLTLSGSSAISSNRAANGAGITHTLGTLGIGANQLNIVAGGSVTSGTAGVTFGNTSLSGAAIFDTAANTNLTLGALSGNFSFTKQGVGSMTLNTASTRTFGSTISAGSVILGNGTALGSGSVTIGGGTLNVTTVNAAVGSVTLNGGNVTGSTGTLALSGVNAKIVSTGASSIASNVALGATREFDVTNILTVSKAISGSGFGINKTNIGELSLSGINTYTGLTDIQNGQVTLKNTGNIAGSIRVASGKTFDVTDFGAGSFTLASGKTLSGNGSVAGKVNIASTAIVSPGDSPGILTGTDMEWGQDGHYVWEFNDASDTTSAGTKFDQIQLSGGLNIAATNAGTLTTFKIDVTSLGAGGNAANFDKTSNYDWVIVTAVGGITGFSADKFELVDFVSNDTSGVNGNPDGSFSLFGDSNSITLRYSAAPEPTSLGLLVLGAAGLLGRRAPRRRPAVA